MRDGVAFTEIPVTPFAKLFELVNPDRTSFELSPEHDAELFIDLDDVAGWLDLRVQQQDPAPQLVITGDFGTGKSHVLRYIEKRLAPDRAIRPVYFELGSFMRRSSFNDLHITVMVELGELLENNLARVQGLTAVLDEKTSLKGDIKTAFTQLADPTLPSAKRAMLRSWLRGTGPTPTQARKDLNFSGRLFDSASSVTLVNIWKAAGELQRAVDGRSLMILMDEGEAFSKMVSPDAQAAMGSGLRTLFDAGNRSLGIALGLNTPSSRKGIHPMLQSDVASRTQGKQRALLPLGDPLRIRRFIEGLWGHLRSPNAAHRLLDEGAMEVVANQLRELRNAISLRSQTLSPTPTQRDLISVLRYVSELAFRDGKSPPLTRDMLNSWFPSKSA